VVHPAGIQLHLVCSSPVWRKDTPGQASRHPEAAAVQNTACAGNGDAKTGNCRLIDLAPDGHLVLRIAKAIGAPYS